MFNIDDPPDPTRPRNPWPRLLAFGAIVLVALVLFGACLVAYTASVPPRQVEVAHARLEPGLPRLLPAVPFGADRFGFTFGAWVVRTPEGVLHAFLSRDPRSGCHVQWNPTQEAGGRAGAFVDPCDGSRYDLEGEVIDGPTFRGLDRFEHTLDRGQVKVNLQRVELGACAPEGAPPGEDCSPPDGDPHFRRLPSGPLR